MTVAELGAPVDGVGAVVVGGVDVVVGRVLVDEGTSVVEEGVVDVVADVPVVTSVRSRRAIRMAATASSTDAAASATMSRRTVGRAVTSDDAPVRVGCRS